MGYLLSNTFEQVADQLTAAEAKAIIAHYASLDAEDIDPEMSETKFFGLLAWCGRTRQIANPYTALAAHRAAWTSSPSTWLANGVTFATRRERLARGELLTASNNTARSSNRKALLWTTPGTALTGFHQVPYLWWNTAGNPGLTNRPGGAANIANANVAALGTACATAINAHFPSGHRFLRINSWPLFPKVTLSPGGETVYYLRDGQATGTWPGIWYTTWKAAVEATWRDWLTAYEAADGVLDVVMLDAEYQVGRWWLQNKAVYSVNITVGGVAVDRNFTVTLGSETFTVTATDSNATTLCNRIQLAWATLDPATHPNLAAMTATHVPGTFRLSVTHDNQSLGYGVPTALTVSATGGGTFTLAVPFVDNRYFPHPNYPAGTTWYDNLKDDERLTDSYINSTYLPTRVQLDDIENWAQTGTPTTMPPGDDPTYRFNEQVAAEFRKAIHEAIYEPLIEFFPDCQLFDYEGTGKCGGVLPSSDPTSPFGSPVGTNFICGTHQSRNIYSGVNQGNGTVGYNTRSDCYVPGTGLVQQSRISELRYTPSNPAQNDVYRATLVGFPTMLTGNVGQALTTTNIDYTVGASPTAYSVAQGMAAAWNASSATHVARITALAVSTGSGGGYVKYTDDGGNQNCEEITFSVTGSGSGTRTLQVSGAFRRVLDDWWILQGMLASTSKPLVPYLCGPSNTTYCPYGPKWNKALNVLAALCSEYIAFWNTGSSATSDVKVEEALDAANTILEGTVGVPLVMPVRTSYDPDTSLMQDILVNGRIKRFTLDKHGDYTVTTQPLLTTIGNQTGEVGSLLTFTAASTGDAPAFSLDDEPSGASIHASTGVFTWTPAVGQGGTYTFDVVVTDGGLTNRETITVQVETPVTNTAPVVDTITTQSANEHSAWSITATAEDAEDDTITWSLGGSPPAGMTINSSTGLISWTPNETHGGSGYSITVIATDDGDPQLSGSKTFTINVSETNTAPVLAAIPDQQGTEGVLLTFTATATDADDPAQTLTYSLTGSPPSGASIDGSTGVFTWTPSSSQSGSYTIGVRVTDNGAGSLHDDQDVGITIADVNRVPVITALPDQTLTVGDSLSLQVVASDPDSGDTLTYSIDDVGIVPDGLEIGSSTGLITWTPTGDQAGDYEVTIRVTDNGTPNLAATTTLSLSVTNPVNPPVLFQHDTFTAYSGQLFSAGITASAGTEPGELTYSLLSRPVGTQAIDPVTGLFTWTPQRNHEGGVFAVAVQVTDQSEPVPLTDVVSFYVAVVRAITIQSSGPTFSRTLFTGGEPAVSLRRPRRWR